MFGAICRHNLFYRARKKSRCLPYSYIEIVYEDRADYRKFVANDTVGNKICDMWVIPCQNDRFVRGHRTDRSHYFVFSLLHNAHN